MRMVRYLLAGTISAALANVASVQIQRKGTLVQVQLFFGVNGIADNDLFFGSISRSAAPQDWTDSANNGQTDILAIFASNINFVTSGLSNGALGIVVPVREPIEQGVSLYMNGEEQGAGSIYAAAILHIEENA